MKSIAIPFTAKCFFTYKHFKNNNQNTILVFADEESTVKAYRQLCFLAGGKNIIYFPSLDTIPYDRVSPNGSILSARATILTELATDNVPRIVVTNAQNLISKLPPREAFANNTISLKSDMQITIKELTAFLIKNGFTRSASSIDSGDFSVRGEIIDLVTSDNQGYRINFLWDKIESIRLYDVNTQISNNIVDRLTISSASEAIINSKTTANFKNKFLQNFGVNHNQSPLYESIISGRKFQGYEHLTPLFYQEMFLLNDFLEEPCIIYDNLAIQSIIEYENSFSDFYQSRISANKINTESFYYAITPDNFIISSNKAKELLANNNNILIESGNDYGINLLDKISVTAAIEQKTSFTKLFETIENHKKKIPVIFCYSKAALERIKTVIKEYEYSYKEISSLNAAKKNYINLTIAPLSQGFFNDKFLFISEQDILGDKFSSQTHKSSKKKLANILAEIDNISENELVVHKEHGIGRFEKIDTITVSNSSHDCLKITYADGDILYLPVENIDLITKYGSSEANLDKLGGVSWQKRKAKLKNRIKDIADQLMKITAGRRLIKSKPIDFDHSSYDQFCRRFTYNETEDQLNAINDVKEDLQKNTLMDRLICGDVGFGKTEVAMRAAFMVACNINDDRPQIAIISPTTILCKQHYQNFMERFTGFGLKIAQLSRLVKPSDAIKIKDDLKSGKINIIIGTHALLAKNIEFKNLKLLIIDEEQHFGVSQKEKLKALKTGVHTLSLSATPIPRTLQMSMSGMKDLSIIATPPIDRLPVRTTVMPFDHVIIRDSLMRERFRGGRSFYVCPRIKDIEHVQKQLDKFVPELKYKIAHGQMPPSTIDQIMTEFSDGKFDILLSSAIIESGIDMPSVNTIVIHRSDMFGLSQLYQLRGRVGRGKVRGYAYLTLDTKRKTIKSSMSRLEILQNIDSLGAGFTIASHDMDMRGFGNLVGSEQSGHIKEVGAELYQEMLDEAVEELKQNQQNDKVPEFTPTINLGINVFIPASYIEDSTLRLAIYRRVGNLRDSSEIENFHDEMIDRFGVLPQEFKNLLDIVRIKNKSIDLKIENLDSGPGGFVIKFNDNFDVSDMVMNFIKKHPRNTKIKPDNKLVYIKQLQENIIIAETEKLLKEMMESR